MEGREKLPRWISLSSVRRGLCEDFSALYKIIFSIFH